MNNHNKNVVKKPWGYEYLAYQNEDVALWVLYIKAKHSTSLHCHPSKTTGLILLSGEVKVNFLNDSNILGITDKIMIRKGLFHSSTALSERGAFILEIETPVDKQDLIRFKDNYGREGKPYEDESYEIPKTEECIWIEEPKEGKSEIYHLANCLLEVRSLTDVKELNQIDDLSNVMFLKGGILAEYGQKVAGPGDIVVAKTLKQLIEVFPKIETSTVVTLFKRGNHE